MKIKTPYFSYNEILLLLLFTLCFTLYASPEKEHSKTPDLENPVIINKALALPDTLTTKEKRIAVLELSGSLSEKKIQALTEKLITELVDLGKSKNYFVVERLDVKKVLEEQKFQKSHCSDDTCAIEIGKLLEADKIVLGSVQKIGIKYSFSFRLIDVNTGAIDQSVSRTDLISFKKIQDIEMKKVAYKLMDVKLPVNTEHQLSFKAKKTISRSLFASSIATSIGALYFFIDQQSIHDDYMDAQSESAMNAYFKYEKTAYTRGMVCTGFSLALIPTSIIFYIRKVKNGIPDHQPGIRVGISKKSTNISIVYNF